MQGWRLGFLGIETIPPWLTEFEVEQFFRLSPLEIATVKTRRGNDMQLGLGLHIGFLRMSGRLLNSTEVIHWRVLGAFKQTAQKFHRITKSAVFLHHLMRRLIMASDRRGLGV